MPLFLAQWWDLRDLGNAAGAFLEWLGDWGPDWLPYTVSAIVGCLAIVLFLVPSQFVFAWAERRLIGRIQSRLGPNRVGPFGLLQTVADTIKLLTKEAITTRNADRWVFWLAPVVVLVPSVVVFAVLPFGEGMIVADLNVGVLFLAAVGSVNAIVVFMAGWSSNNKFALLGAMREVAMLISYEIPQVLALLGVVIFTNTMSLGGIVRWQDHYNTWLLFLQPLAVVVYLIAGSVEINRTPTDIAEAESEIVAGYHTEYSGIKFGFFYAGEYFGGFAIAAIVATLYLGGWSLWGLEEWVPGWIIFLAKLYAVFWLFMWMRGTLPRLRIDQLMGFAWKFLLPLTLINIFVVGLEVLLWQENDLAAGVVLPAFAVTNLVLAVVLTVAWARLLGHARPGLRPRRARLMQELGAIVYGQES
ncbi:MAG: NADH-quinone oxidoreductase subunit NuoH [Chloroflexota bacterium]|nr:NADH-quinone oxidoreductase subunit NuoH [Chloroflexota bacterium]